MMQWIKPGTNIDFIAKRRPFLLLTAVLIVASLALVAVRGLNWGLDFKGGYEFQLKFKKAVTADVIHQALTKAGIDGISLQTMGDRNQTEYLLHIKKEGGVDEALVKRVRDKLKAELPATQVLKEFLYSKESPERIRLVLLSDPGAPALQTAFETAGLKIHTLTKSDRSDHAEYAVVLETLGDKVEPLLKSALKIGQDESIVASAAFVGPQVGEQLRNQGVMAVLLSFVFMLLYIAFRFDFYFGPGAIACLVHDTIVTVGAFALTGKEFNLQTIAALLTIIGYSMNDTIVVFDRIRENNVRLRHEPLETIVNRSLNETLSRTLLTTFVTSLVVLAMVLLGGPVLADFGFALLVGFGVGTYSSIAVAAPIYVALRKRFDKGDSASDGAIEGKEQSSKYQYTAV